MIRASLWKINRSKNQKHLLLEVTKWISRGLLVVLKFLVLIFPSSLIVHCHQGQAVLGPKTMRVPSCL